MSERMALAEQLLQRIGRLHSAPQTVQKILELTRQPDYSVPQLAKCLEMDPALAAQVLRVVNSARYGLRHPISSVRQAAVYLGPRSLRLLALTFGLVRSLTHGAAAEVCQGFWRRSLVMAGTASRLAGHADESEAGGPDETSTEEAYTAGLLADVGTLILAEQRTADYLPLVEQFPHGAALTEAERAAFGFDHADLGGCLLRRWGLPETIIAAVGGHHEPVTDADRLALAVTGAHLFSEALWRTDRADLAAAQEFLRDNFEIDTDGLIDLASGCRDDIRAAAETFGVTGQALQALPDIENLLDAAREQHAALALETAIDLDSLAAAYEATTGSTGSTHSLL